MLRRHFKIIGILCLISSLARFVLDSYLPSLPAISGQFNISSAGTQWTLTIYLLGFSLSQLIYGPLSDCYGRRSVMLAGMLVLFTGSAVCSMATSLVKLMIARLVAGIGAGACGALNRAIASDCFNGADFSRAWSYTTTTLVMTLMVAPVLGGIVQDVYGWRFNFILTALLAGLVFIIVLKYLPETHRRPDTSSFHVRSVLKNYRKILASRIFILCTLCYTLAFSGLIVYFQVSPFLYIDVFGLTASQYGWTSVSVAVCYLLGGIVVNILSRYYSMRKLLLAGSLLLISGGGLMLLSCVLYQASMWLVMLSSAIYVLGARIIIPNAIAGSMEQFREISGSSSAVIGCMQMLGSCVISLLISGFDDATPLPMGFFFLAIGGLCVYIVWRIRPASVSSV